MVDFGESDKVIKIKGKVVKSNTYSGFSRNISFFINRTLSEKIYFVFMYILAIEEKDKRMGNVKRYKVK